MAQEHNALKYGTTLSRAASRAVGLGDLEEGMGRLGETLTPIVNLWQLPEWALLRGERRWTVTPSVNAVVGEVPQVGIRNPTGSLHIVVVEGFAAFVSVVSQLEVRSRAQGTVDATGTPTPLDTRIGVTNSGLVTVSLATSEAAALGSLLQRYNVGAAATWGVIQYKLNYVLSPGFEVFIGSNTTNNDLVGTLWGRERLAFPGELQAR